MDEEWLVRQADQAGHLTRLAERAQSTFWGLLGCEVVRADAGKATICLDATDRHLNLLGLVHGGVIMSLLDNAMGLVVMLAETGERAVTANLNTQFLTSSRGGSLICEAELVHRTERTLTLQAQVKDDGGKLLAWGSGAYRVL
ncbi:PaaI family thioesterase [Paenibacillus arenilitoris]|uniref:PaaI family thioesterase n=1 Tax=Paenibacillus arenilitoris TaxID=2772299 RepID=A0A927CRS0_9BACL|nr:PaaI family thioesterase [Paenibacillus arenilitoris]MBD2872412.1 PaaI family thioesterase [Paenibacillus arenilitoris]